MKKLYFLSVLFFLSFSFLSAQQRVSTATALRLIEEKLMREKPNLSARQSINPFEGMVKQGLSAPTGVFIDNISSEELRKQSTFFGGDSLNGFVFEKAAKEITKNNEVRLLNEFKAAMRRKEIEFIKNKYNIADATQPASQLPLSITARAIPQNSTSASLCNNIDFEDGNTNTWTVTSGYNQNSNAQLTIPASAFTVGVITTDQNIYSCSDLNIITAAYGNDPIGFPGLDPNGATTSVRLGGFNINASDGYGFGCTGSHWTTGSFANGEKIEKTLLVTAANALLSYDYAVVLNDGGHANGAQPYFHVYVTDLAGTVLSTCTQYYVQATAGGPPAGFINSGYVNTYDNSVFYYRNWTSNSINLTPYIGSSVKIEFVAAGCTLGAHPGYAYVDAICGPLAINSSNNGPCVGQTAVLTAPSVQSGTYAWTGTGVTGLTTQSVTVNTTGTYSCVITPAQGASCSYTVTHTINFTPLPTANAGSTQSLTCANASTVLAGSGGGTYSWSGPGIVSGGATANPTVNAVGNYTLTVTSSGCTSLPATVAVGQNTTQPASTAGTSASVTCSSNTISLTSGPGSMNYTWTAPGGSSITGGVNNQNTTGSGPGVYTVTVKDPSNGCSKTATVAALINTVVPVPSASTSGAVTCTSSAVSFTANPSAMNYTWTAPGGSSITGGVNSQSTTGSGPGTYSVLVKDPGNGCSATATVAAVVNTTAPVSSAVTAGSVTCASGAISFTANPSAMNYTWTAPGGSSITGGVNSQSTTGSGPGTYSVLVKNPANGCSATATVAANVNTTAPTATASSSGVITCTNNSINLTVNPGGLTYLWSAGGGGAITGGGSTQNATATGNATYSVLVTAANGCTVNATTAASVNLAPPTLTVSSAGVITCSNNAISLTVNPAGSAYVWTAGGGGTITAGGTSQTATANGNATYSVVLTTSNGCTVMSTVSPSVNMVPPTLTITTSGVITCTNSAITLSVSPSGSAYSWTAGGGASITGGATLQNASGSGNGTYSVVLTTSNGCTVMATKTPSVNNAPPTSTASATGVITCTNNAINLTVNPGGNSYVWSASAGGTITSGGSSQNATANGNATYSVLVTSAVNGCTVYATTTPSVNQTVITPTITAPTVLTCKQNTVALNATPLTGVTYTWSAVTGTNIVSGINNSTVAVNAPAVYTLAITNTVNGCVGSATIQPTQSLTTPTVSAPTQTANLICGATSVVLSGTATPAASTPTWSSSGGGFASGVNSYTVAATTATTYVLAASHPVTGCISSITFTVIPDVNSPTVTLLPSSGTITCLTTLLSTTATSNPSSGVTYQWSGPGIVGTNTTAVVSGSLSGTYNLTVTNTSNSCSSNVAFNIVPNNAPVTATAVSTNTLTCNTVSTSITAGSTAAGTYTYNWSGPSSFTSTAQTFTTSAGGTYTAFVTNTSSGCTGSITIAAVTNTTAPTGLTVTPSSFTLPCAPPAATLVANATGAASYSWTAPAAGSITSGTTAATAGISGPGNYSVVAIGSNGCSSTVAIAAIAQSTLAPSYTVSNTSPSITCNSATPSVGIVITSTVPITSYSWSPTSGMSGPTNTNTAIFNTAGTYTAVITATNGCQSNAIITVNSATTIPTFAAGSGTAAPLGCGTNSIVTIAPTFTPASGSYTYTWSGAGIVGSTNNSSVTVNANGNYSLAITDTVTGCTNAAIVVPVFGSNVPPTLTVTSTSSIGIGCTPATGTITLTANTTPTSGVIYGWSTSATTPTISTSTPGTYTVSASDATSGCSVVATYAVTNNTLLPTVNAGAAANLPCGSGATLTLNGSSTTAGVTYTWNGNGIVSGANTASPTVNSAGAYTLTVTNATTGCSASSTVAIASSSVLAGFTADVVSGTSPLTVNLTNTSTGATAYGWDFGNSTVSSNVNPSVVYGSTGSYVIILTASSGLCSDTAAISITVSDGLTIQIPNVFTPNDDGVNDLFTITSTGVKEITLQIFNRWGQKMYEFVGAKAGWDGMTVSGRPAADGTYFYFVKVVGFDGQEINKNGAMSLFR